MITIEEVINVIIGLLIFAIYMAIRWKEFNGRKKD